MNPPGALAALGELFCRELKYGAWAASIWVKGGMQMEVKDLHDTYEDHLRRLMAAYKNDLMRMCCVWLRDASLAEDAVQETFVKAYRAMADFRGDCSEKTWLMRIAVNTCRSMRRSWWSRMVDRSVTPDMLAEMYPAAMNEDLCLVEDVMRLPDKEKAVILLYYYQNMSVREVAQALGIGISAVSMRLKKARTRLRGLLEEGDDADE